jgi:Transposase
VLAYFDRPGTSNGPTEAINGRLEHLRGSALGFRNLTNYIANHCWRPADSDPDYTLDHEEPVNCGIEGVYYKGWEPAPRLRERCPCCRV